MICHIGIDKMNDKRCLLRDIDLGSEDSINDIQQEIAIRSTFIHPNLEEYFGAELVNKNQLRIAQELLNGKSISEFVNFFISEIIN